MRSENNRYSGVEDGQIDTSRSGFEIDLQGVGAEMACGRIHNCYPDFSINIRSAKTGTDRRFDLMIHWPGARHDDVTVDVKATKLQDGLLLVRPRKAEGPTPDYYALMVGDFPTYTFVGFIAASELLRPERLKDVTGHGKSYCASQDELETDIRLAERWGDREKPQA